MRVYMREDAVVCFVVAWFACYYGFLGLQQKDYGTGWWEDGKRGGGEFAWIASMALLFFSWLFSFFVFSFFFSSSLSSFYLPYYASYAELSFDEVGLTG
jgi:hypothetical protein